MAANALLATASIPDPLAWLACAEVEIEGRMPWSSNATFLVRLRGTGAGGDPAEHRAIYKPVRGERPLWDFEPGLHRRETAAFVLSEHLGIDVVPPTVIRDGPLGVGSVQWFVDADHREHYFTILADHEHLHQQCADIAVLDVIANNTDRKSGHCLLAGDRVWAIDNGLCFSADDKLRTVIWEFAGDPIRDELLHRVAAVAADPSVLSDLLEPVEVDAVARRAANLVEAGCLPSESAGRYPWPLV